MAWVKPKVGYFWCEIERNRTLCDRGLREIGPNLEWTGKTPDDNHMCPRCRAAKEGNSQNEHPQPG